MPLSLGRRSRLALIAALAAITLAATACSGSADPNAGGGGDKPGYGGTLKIASLNSDLDALDTLTGYSIDSWQILRAISRQLVTFPGSPKDLGSDNKIQGDLAKSWDVSPDGKTYTFHLRDNVHFSGSATREIVAGDFVYGVKRFCDPNKQVAAINYFNLIVSGFESYCDEFSKQVKVGDLAASKAFIDSHDIAGIQAPDDKTVVLTSPSKNYDTLSILAMNFVSPIPEEVASKYVGDSLEYRKHYPSSGPYEISDYQPGNRLILTKVKDYDHAGDPARKAYVDEIDVDFTANSEDAVVQKIQSGEADLSLYLTTPPIATIQQYTRSKSPDIHSSDGAGASFAFLNTNPKVKTPGSDALRKLKVRQALTYAVNRAHLQQIFGGELVAKPLSQIIISNQLGYEDIDPYPTDGDQGDPAKAKQLLADAGYPAGIAFNVVYRSNALAESEATTLKEDVAKSGITLNLHKLSPDEAYSYVQSVSNPWDIAINGQAFAPDWQGDSTRMLLGGWLDSDGAPCGPGNPGAVCYDNKQLNKLASQAFASDDPAPVWAQADELVSTDLPWIPLLELRKVVITSDRVRNYTWSNVPVNPDVTNVAVQG
ncbi:ABC transporter substrate-binding protein [Nocardioides sp. CER19]|uniref:ABC transporter substrate-binding protein n=1 Tax=Nocardioides sp. CER19 TaxID=3038538 RepID=UPI0024481A5C|nr:ABC transporter substrate-binding protein [Nocardioides sp. CER19]MDH2414152.1 ABC transporter substrate-binding protein [Nocardioides sp. CER19]